MSLGVKEFCGKYQISQQAVYAKIKRKSAQLDGHIAKSGGVLLIDEYAEEALKPHCADFTITEKARNYKNQLEGKIAECENLKISLAEEISKNAELQNQLNDANVQIADLQNRLTEQNLKNADFEKSAAMLKSEILKISDKVDMVQNSVSELAKRGSGGIAGLLKR